MPRNHFTKNLRVLMDRHGYLPKHLAQNLTCCSDANVRSWLRGHQPGYNMLMRIAEVFEVTIDELLKEEIK